MATLPTDIITSILTRLPVKSLVHFKCVSKFWYSSIQNPEFIKLHLTQTLTSNSDHHLVVIPSDHCSLHSVDLDIDSNRISFLKINHPLKPTQSINFIGSCNGVVCISDSSKYDVFLYNPLTNSHRRLPENLLPDLDKNALVFGFGYDAENDDYKVLRMVQGRVSDCGCTNEAKVYSLKSNSWKTIQGIPYYFYFKHHHGVLVNEALHFIVEPHLDYKLNISGFNLRTESFSLMDFPKDDVCSGNFMLHLAELGGCLCLVANYHSCDIDEIEEYGSKPQLLEHVDVWVMKEYGKKESWVRLFRISHPESIGPFGAYLLVKPLVYRKEGGRILLDIDCLGLGWYDLKSNEFESCTVRGLRRGAWEMTYFVGRVVFLEDKPRLVREILPRKSIKKNNMDNFLTAGFKLRL